MNGYKEKQKSLYQFPKYHIKEYQVSIEEKLMTELIQYIQIFPTNTKDEVMHQIISSV